MGVELFIGETSLDYASDDVTSLHHAPTLGTWWRHQPATPPAANVETSPLITVKTANNEVDRYPLSPKDDLDVGIMAQLNMQQIQDSGRNTEGRPATPAHYSRHVQQKRKTSPEEAVDASGVFYKRAPMFKRTNLIGDLN